MLSKFDVLFSVKEGVGKAVERHWEAVELINDECFRGISETAANFAGLASSKQHAGVTSNIISSNSSRKQQAAREEASKQQQAASSRR
jgi:hypothetical protein